MTAKTPRGRWIGTAVISAALALFGALIGEGLTRVGALRSADESWRPWTVYLLYALVGGLVLRHSARNVVGLLVAVMGVVPLFGSLGEVVVLRGIRSGLAADLATWIVGWYFYGFIAAILLLLHVFPSGQPKPGVWTWFHRIALLASGALVLVYLFGPHDDAVNPFEIPIFSAAAPVLTVVIGVGLVGAFVTGVTALGVRFRQSRGRERAQLKWFFLSVVVALALFLGSGFLSEVIPRSLGAAVEGAAFTIPALGIMMAITLHGLFDIDRLVSRTVTYTVVAGVLATLYVVPVIVLPEALGLSSDVAVAGATLLAAAAFAPLRRRVQRWVDRRFNRARYDAERMVSGLSGRVQALADRGAVVAELGGAAVAALQPRSVAVWLRAPGS